MTLAAPSPRLSMLIGGGICSSSHEPLQMLAQDPSLFAASTLFALSPNHQALLSQPSYNLNLTIDMGDSNPPAEVRTTEQLYGKLKHN